MGRNRSLLPNSVLSTNAIRFHLNDPSIVRTDTAWNVCTNAGGGRCRCFERGYHTAPPESSKPPFQPAFPSHAKTLMAPAVPREHRVFSRPVTKDAFAWERSRQRASLSTSAALLYPKSTAIGTDSCNHQGNPASQLTGESIMDNGSHEDSPSLDLDTPSYVVKIQKAKKQNLLQHCAPTESVQHQQISRNEASPYCFIHFIPKFYYFIFLSFSKFATHCKCKERKHTRLRQRAQPF